MGVVFALYSKNRNVLYHMDKQNHEKILSKYIRSKYPNDEWIQLKDCDSDYGEIIDKFEELKIVDILDPDDEEGWALYQEIKILNK